MFKADHHVLLTKHDHLYRESDHVKSVFRVRAGHVMVGRTTERGQLVAGGVLGPGDLFGVEEAVSGSERYDAWAKCVSAEATIEVMSASAFVASADPRKLSETMAAAAIARERHNAEMAKMLARDRIRSILADHAVRLGAIIDLTHEELAAIAVTTREKTTREIHHLTLTGALAQVGNGHLRVMDMRALEA